MSVRLVTMLTLISAVLPMQYTSALAPSKATDGAKAYFISPKDGDIVSNPVHIVFGLKGMGVAPAGTNKEHTGHHHLIINAATPKTGQVIPADANHKHFGKGQTETTLALPEGTNTLQLVLGDYLHRPHDKPVVSEVITITIK